MRGAGPPRAFAGAAALSSRAARGSLPSQSGTSTATLRQCLSGEPHMTLHSAVVRTSGPPVRLFATIFSFPPLLSRRKRREVLLYSSAARGWGSRANDSDLRVFRAGAPRLPHEFWLGGSDMSFQVVRHEHPNILVVNRQTYETYRLTVGENGSLVQDGARSDLREAHRAAMAFLGAKKSAARVERGPLCPSVQARRSPSPPSLLIGSAERARSAARPVPRSVAPFHLHRPHP